MTIYTHTIKDVNGKSKEYAKAYSKGTARVLTPYKTEFYHSTTMVYASVWAKDKKGKTYQTAYSNQLGKVGVWVPTNERGNHYRL